MAEDNSIPCAVANQIVGRLYQVGDMLRSIPSLTYTANTNDEYIAVASAAAGLSERAHQIIDACIAKLGGTPMGNFDDNEWECVEEEGGAA